MLMLSVSWAVDPANPIVDEGTQAPNVVSQQLQKGVSGNIGLSPPVIENIIKQGIKLPGELAVPEESAVKKEEKVKESPKY